MALPNRHIALLWAACFAAFSGCAGENKDPGPRTTGSEELMQIPGITTQNPAVAGGQNSNTPMRPLGVVGASGAAYSMEGVPNTCDSDADCVGSSFTHCVKDVPEEVGICSRECESHSECTANASWSCGTGTWDMTTGEQRQMCLLTCVNNIECPTGTSCNGGYCGTPCSGNNCEMPVCEENFSVECSGNAVFWFDSCGDIGALKEVCDAGEACVYGRCFPTSAGETGGSTGGSSDDSTDDESCGGRVRRCGNSTTVNVENACGEVISAESCTGGKQCSAGMCQCVPTSRTQCSGGQLWRLDSCGNRKGALGPC